MDDAATHIPALVEAIERYGKCVLEIGVGCYSTTVIAGLCPAERVIHLDSHAGWMKFLEPIIAGGNTAVARDIVAAAIGLKDVLPWNVVFIDCEKGEDRAAIAKAYLDVRCCIVAHDTERDYWADVIRIARYQRHFRTVKPNTSFFSNTLDVSEQSKTL